MQALELLNLSSIRLLQPHFNKIKRGIEKESLRVSPNGSLSQVKHPHALGAALTNRYITTDYSEALPELITTPSAQRLEPLAELKEIHQFLYQSLGDELLWGTSMPCTLSGEGDIPIAQYGSSNSGKMKEIYRVGLGHRYGRFMQTIAGVHYNFSLPKSFWKAYHQQENSTQDLQAFISEKYMGLIRNYLRHAWLIPLFYGASPALCESFLKNKRTDLDVLVPGTRYGPYATSLRMSDLGYQNKVQSQIKINYNSLDEYVAGLENAISTPAPHYQALGTKWYGESIQLNENILQIENEFYSAIRPKRVSQSGERPSIALKKGGIEYIEVRTLDINPFSNVGIAQSQISFMDSFLLACLFTTSPPISAQEQGVIQENFKVVVRSGRDPDLRLRYKSWSMPLVKLAKHLLSAITPVSILLDEVYQTGDHLSVINQLTKQLGDLDATFSGKMVKTMKAQEKGFSDYAMDVSMAHKHYFSQNLLSSEKLAHYQKEAMLSHQTKALLESSDKISFEAFLANYYA